MTVGEKSRKSNDLLLALPQDYVAELFLERGPRWRGLLRDSITHPFLGSSSRSLGRDISERFGEKGSVRGPAQGVVLA